MTGRRRGLALAGLALLLGGLAASDVAGREAALERRIGPSVDVVVATRPLVAGRPLRPDDLAVRRVPSRFAPAGVATSPEELVGARLATSVAAGTDLGPAMVEHEGDGPGAPVRTGERVVDVVAVGSSAAIQSGGRVDVLVTRERGDGLAGRTELALEDVEVLAVRGAAAAPGERAGDRVAASLRVTLRQAVYLAAAQSFARELRLLPRAAGDRRVTKRGLAVSDAL